MPGLMSQIPDLEQCIHQEPNLEQPGGVALIGEHALRDGGPAADMAPKTDEERERRHREKKEKKERKVKYSRFFNTDGCCALR